MSKQALWNRDFIGIWLSNFLIFTTFYALIATLPIYVIDILKGNKQQIGPIMTSFLIAAVLFRPLAGKWLDELGRKKLLFASLALFLASTVMYLGVRSFMLLVALRFLHGISFGIATTATGTIATDVIPEKRKGEGIGYYALSFNMAMVVGPFLGLTLISKYNFTLLFVLFSIFSLLAFVCGSLTKVPAHTPTKDKPRKSLHWKNFIEPNAIPISLVGIFLSFAYSGLLTFLPVYAKELGLEGVASYFYVVYAMVMVLSRPFTGKIFDRFGEKVIMYPSMALYVVGLISLSQSHTSFMLLASGAIIGLGYGTLFPSLQTIAIMLSPIHRRGLATGTFLLFFDTGIGFGASALGLIASSSSYRIMYLFASAVVVLSAITYYVLCHRRKPAVHNHQEISA
ncbi:MAG TPA: MFS transporter [Bacillota bacterium]|nr:MFS transporter [Bacillota bacterium]